jgi:hypothetical protein
MFQNEPLFTEETDHAGNPHNITTDLRPTTSNFTANEPKLAFRFNNDLSEILNDGSQRNTDQAAS